MNVDPSVFLNYGIAGFLAVYLVYFITDKLNKKMDKLTNRIDELKDEIRKLNNNIERLVYIIARGEK